ncbi:MAG TPA: D-glycero-beta-D-manno-heptose-7-phosphate kinase [Deltaproteobacteria bacterium]|nr:D-glycero-beta-D-manno-heptose-7-phosphate kinase [Deltaproteobacteria bacterium]
MRKIVGRKRATGLVDSFRKASVLVVGDVIMDHFIWGKVERISPEAPVPVVEVTRETVLLGGSANVVNNITALGGRCYLTGIVGRDRDGTLLLKMLRERGVELGGIVVDSRRPTTIKTRIIAHSQQVVRFDREKKSPISRKKIARILDYVEKTLKKVDVVVVSDYSKGLVTEELMEGLKELARQRQKPIVVDPKVEHFHYYHGVELVTPNNLEASRASGVEIRDEETLHRAGRILLDSLGSKAVLITRGEQGMSLFEKDRDTHIPTVAREVYDVSGAGDTVVGVMALALSAGADYREAAVLANMAAGIVVGKVGTAVVHPEELLDVIKERLS